MLAVQAGLADVESVVASLDGVDIAAVNGPTAVVVSGVEAAVEQVREHFAAAGVKTRGLTVSHAFHSALMEPMLAEFEQVASGISYRRPEIVVVSNLTGRAAGEEIGTAAYWVRHVREAVRFGDGIEWLSSAGVRKFLELGPDATLTAMAADCLPADSDAVLVAATRREHDEVQTLTSAVSRLWCTGTDVDWPAFFTGHTPRHVDLPTYAFQHRHFWLTVQEDDAPAPADAAEAGFWEAVERQDVAALVETLAGGAQGTGDEEALRELLPALSSWRRRQRESSAVDGCRYAVSWRPLPPREPALGGRWLVVVPERPADRGFVDAVCAAVASAGAAVETVEVHAGDAVRLELADHLGELLAEGARPAGVLSLLACAEEDAPDPDGLPYPVAATVALLQALGDAGVDAPLWCATRNAVAVTSTDPAPVPEQSALWGLGRVAGLELPHGWGGLVDLPAAVDDRARRLLAGALAAPGGEDQVAVRPAGLHARRLVHAPAAGSGGPGAAVWPTSGTVLVTGGTGALGAEVARSLAAAGAEHLLLVSRGGPQAPGAEALADELRRAGARVTVAACDAADRDRLAEVLAGVPADAPLRAVVHTAGVVDDGILASLTPESMRRVLRPKAAAARNLHELTLGRELDAFVLFSSFSGTVGTLGQAAYAAANAYLDALAEQRRAAGLPALSVAWGPWAGGGMAGDRAVEAGVRRSGLVPLPPERGVAALERALARGEATVAVVDVDWERFASGFTANRPSPLLADLPELRGALRAPSGAAPEDGAGGAGELVRRLAALPGADRARAVLDLVRDHVAAVLGHSSAQAVPPDRPFKDLGFDSLTAVNLRNRLGTHTGLHLPATLVFDYPTATALARHLTERLLPDQAADDTPAAAGAARADDDPIAIISMGCRFPGDVTSPEELWRLLSEGRDAITRYPDDRGWDIDELYDPDPAAPGRTYGRDGGFVRDAGMFDAAFFGISPREAVAMDPQQRLLLESSWEVVERAGIDPLSLRGSRTGVFVGLVPFDYAPSHGPGLEELEGFLGIGTSSSVASGRVAYSLGLEGQAVTVDTACSSSLVALHLAAQALRQGECDLALAGGVTVLPSPSLFIEFSRQRALSADGRCRAFSAAADGFGPAEGIGVLLLERLSDARRNGHRVLAVVKGSAINQDGASNGLTAPNGPSQQRVIRQALANAGLSPADVDAVEAHGTGTSLGDPIEAQALLATYGQDRPEDRPLWLGSIKSNLGHTQAAAGMAGVIKMVMAMREGVLPRTLHADEPSPHVDWTAGRVALLTEAKPWDTEDGRPRRAGVSSFGISGTNAHVILEAPEEPGPRATTVAAEPVLDTPVPPWLLSARDPEALRAQAARVAEHAAATGADPVDIGWALLTRRAHLEHRAVVHGTDLAALVEAARALAEDAPADTTATGRTGATGGVTFVFPGQGSQWIGMGREMLAASPVFAARLAECEAALTPFTGWSVTELLTGSGEGASWLERADIVQPLLWAVMVSLAAVWESLGVVPSVVVGHSQGEIAAAVVAGALSLEDGARVIAARSALAAPLAAHGTLLSVAAGAEWTRDRIARWGGALSVAAVNGPSATVVSGPHGALDELTALLDGEGVWHRRVTGTYASHSPMMEPLRDELLAALRGVAPRASRVPLISTVTGELQDTAAMDADYWYTNLRETVEFSRAVETAVRLGHTTVVEVSPHPVLVAAVQETAEAAGAPATAVGTLRRDDGGPARLTANAAELWATGVPVDWRPLYAGRTTRHVDLPTYPFQRRRYWLQARGAAGDPAGLGLTAADHPLLGAAVRLAAGDGLLLTGRLAARTQPWLADHRIAGTPLLPGSALVELAVRAGDEADCGHLRELVLQQPLALPEHGGVRLQIVVGAAAADGTRTIGIHSRPEDAPEADPWTCHAEGVLTPEPPAGPGADLAAWPPPGADPVDVTGFYPAAEAAGYGYGPAFQGLRAAWRRGDEVYAEVALPEAQRADANRYGLHPALLDAALQAAAVTAARDGGLRQPFAWSGVSLLASGATELRVRLTPEGDGATRLLLADPAGQPVAEVAALVQRTVDPARLTAPAAAEPVRVTWTPLAVAAADDDADDGAVFAGAWAVLGEDPLGAGAAVQDTGRPVDAYPDPAALRAVLDAGVPAPECVLLAHAGPAPAAGLDGLLAEWLADDRLTATRLAVVTRGAVTTGPGAEAEPEAAAVWHRVTAAQTAHPGRLLLIDLDDDAGRAPELLAAALRAAAERDEPRVAVHREQALVPRAQRLTPAPAPRALAGEGTLLLATPGTGAPGGELAAAVARHLAAGGGPRRLVLAAPADAGPVGLPADLEADLKERGIHLQSAVLDPADPAWPAAPTAVVDTTGDPAVTRRLDELTRGTAEAFLVVAPRPDAPLEALVRRRRADGLPGTLLTPAPWDPAGDGTPGGLTAAAVTAALGHDEPVLHTALLDPAALRRRAQDGTLPAELRHLAPAAPAPAARRRAAAGAADGDTGADLAQRLAAVPAGERERFLADLVRRQAAAVLGHASADEVDTDRPFKDLGFDSMMSVQLRNRLGAETGLTLPATLAFTYPTPEALAAHLLERLGPGDGTGDAEADRVITEIERLETALAALESAADGDTRTRIAKRLQNVLWRWNGTAPTTTEGPADGVIDEDALESATDDEMFDLIDRELGSA
ncbi:hypothetical protein GCM10027168_73880 [Streptomyces capparidis]